MLEFRFFVHQVPCESARTRCTVTSCERMQFFIWYDKWYDIFVKLQSCCHPVAVVQYTFTHKQYTERHKTNNT